jgi:hypothetical protein
MFSRWAEAADASSGAHVPLAADGSVWNMSYP